MKVESKISICKASVRPIIIHEEETHSETGKIKQITRTTEMKSIRMITEKTLHDKTKNAKTRKDGRVTDIENGSEKNEYTGESSQTNG